MWRAGLVVTMIVGVIVPMAGPASAAQRTLVPDKPGLELVGTIPGAEGTAAGSTTIVAMLGEQRKLINYRERDFTPYLASYDVSTAKPRLLKEVPVPAEDGFENYYLKWGTTIAADEARHRLLKLGLCRETVSSCIYRYNTDSLRSEGPAWDLGRESNLYGFIGFGLTYSRADDRIYLIGEISGTSLISEQTAGNFFGIKPQAVTAVAALEGASGKIAWVKPVPQCVQPLVTTFTGSVIARSDLRNALYFGCMRTQMYPGLAGVTRLWLDPGNGRKATQDDALSLRAEFFPISGSVVSTTGVYGLMAFDRQTDRVILQSVATASPGAWVFDGLMSAWVGQMATPRQPVPEALGISEYTGHVYMGSLSVTGQAYLDVADARATPVPQGTLYRPLPSSIDSIGNVIVTDPKSRRLFLAVRNLKSYGLASKDVSGYLVLEDRTPDALPPVVADFDDLTTNVPEGLNTEAAFTGSTSGYGMRANLVGGYGGIRSRAEGSHFTTGDTTSRFDLISPGDRGFFASRVPSLDLRNTGASASAQALSPDVITDSDRGGIQTLSQLPPSQVPSRADDVADSLGVATDGRGESAGNELDKNGVNADPYTTPSQARVAPLANWPWLASTCLDAGGTQTDARPAPPPAGPGGTTQTQCNYPGTFSSASTSFGPVSVDLQDGGKLRVAFSSFDTRAFRDDLKGLVTVSVAQARGIELDLPGTGSLTIGRIVAEAQTQAAGRPRTAHARWTRTFYGLKVLNDKGQLVFACDDGASGSDSGTERCNPEDVANELNARFESQVRFRLPLPQKDETPKGAYAGVQKLDRDYYNDLATNNQDSRAVPALDLLIVNDSVGKSRLHVQLAAIQAGSIYGISVLTDPFIPNPGGPFPIPDITQPPGLPEIPVLNDPPTVVQPGVVIRAIKESLFLVRSPKEALLVAIVWSLFAAAAAGAMRRRKLMKLLQEGP